MHCIKIKDIVMQGRGNATNIVLLLIQEPMSEINLSMAKFCNAEIMCAYWCVHVIGASNQSPFFSIAMLKLVYDKVF